MKLYIVGGILVVGLLIVALNPNLIADQVLNWAKQNPLNENTPQVIFDTGRVCEFLTDGDSAIEMFSYLHDQYPKNAALCAPAMYYAGKIKAESSYIKVIRMQAVPFLQTVLDEYSDLEDWYAKSKQLMSEVTGEHI